MTFGFDMYHKVLDEAIQELKETEFKGLFEDDLKESVKTLITDCIIETDHELIIPEDYVSNITERLSLYSSLDNIKNETELEAFTKSMIDRFGQIPSVTNELIKTVRLRWMALKIGVEKLTLKNGKMNCYLPPSSMESYYKSDVFGKFMSYIQMHPSIFQLREKREKLILSSGVTESIDDALARLSAMVEFIEA